MKPMKSGAASLERAPSKKASPEGIMHRLIARHQLDRIEIVTIDGKNFIARAYPASWGEVVRQRRETAFAAAGKTEFSLTEANAISDRAAAAPLCHGSGSTIFDALAALQKELNP